MIIHLNNSGGMSALPAKILHLRQLLAERFPAAAGQTALAPAWRTGIARLDAVGVPKAAVTELVDPRACGGGALLMAEIIRNAAASGQRVALIDGRSSFHPQRVGPVAAGRLLWAQCRTAAEALKASDLVLRDGNLALVLLDLALNPAAELNKIPNSLWFRLQGLAEKTGIPLLVATPRPLVSSARLRLVLEPAFSLDALDADAADLLDQLRLHVQRRRLSEDGSGASPLVLGQNAQAAA